MQSQLQKKEDELRAANKKIQSLEKDMQKSKGQIKTIDERHEKDLEVNEARLNETRKNLETSKRKLEDTEKTLNRYEASSVAFTKYLVNNTQFVNTLSLFYKQRSDFATSLGFI